MRIEDELLVLQAQAGDSDAFDALVGHWHATLLRHATRLLAADAARDATQEAWVAVVKGLRQLEDPARFPAWALRIVTCAARDVLRRRGRQRTAETRVASTTPRASASPTADDGTDVATDALRAAVARLPHERRCVVELFYLDGLPVHDIADVLGIPPGTVKSRLLKARAELRAALAERSDIPIHKE
jgi:RNA polymerase sigma-70 factor (ECF subfamily)